MRCSKKLWASAAAALVVRWLSQRPLDGSGSGIGRVAAIFDTSFRQFTPKVANFEMRFKITRADEFDVFEVLQQAFKIATPLTHAVFGGILSARCQKMVYWFTLQMVAHNRQPRGRCYGQMNGIGVCGLP